MGKKDPLAEAYKRVRDATLFDKTISNAEKIAILELVKHEILRNIQAVIDKD